LNEALKIAAMDIAEVAEADDDYFLSDEEEGEDEEGEGDDDRDMKSVPSAMDDGRSDTISMATASATSNPGAGIGGSAGRGSEKRNSKNKKAATERKEERYREVLGAGGAAGNGGSSSSKSTFVIQEDGSFQRK
jgi:hypothetical protein